MANRYFSNTTVLMHFMLRRDRMRIPIWFISLAGITVLVAKTFTEMYPNAVERQAIAETMVNPAMTAMIGPVYGVENYTIGAMIAHQMLLFTAITFGLMSILFVVRHTRTDEEEGRIELIRSLPTGRLSTLASTVIIGSSMNILFAVLIGLSLYALGIESMGLKGSLLYGAALGASGIFFTAMTAIFVQLSENARNVIGYSLTSLGIAYLIRAIGDVGDGVLSWFSPFGWVLAAEVYVHNYWWPIVLTVVISILLMGIALYLNSIRDLGAGFISAKPGRTYASALLLSPLGLLFRLQRTGLIAWAIGMFIFGMSYGSVFGDLDSFFLDNELLKEMLTAVDGYSLVEQFLPMLMSVMAMVGTIPAIMAMNKVIGEERKNRTEHLLSRPVSRLQIIGSSLLISIVISFVVISLAAIGLWSAGSISMGDELVFSEFYRAGIVYVPAMFVMTGLAALLVGVFPKLTSVSWAYLIYSFIVVYLGSLLDVPKWMTNMTPFGHIPQVPIEEVDVPKMGYLLVIAIVLMVIGILSFRRRDIEG